MLAHTHTHTHSLSLTQRRERERGREREGEIIHPCHNMHVPQKPYAFPQEHGTPIADYMLKKGNEFHSSRTYPFPISP